MAKMINADELIEFCNTERAMLHAHNNSVACAALRRVVEFAKEYPEPVNSWISVKDRLPENETEVLIYCPEFVYTIKLAMWIEDGFYVDREDLIVKPAPNGYCTHWQHLLEPPKGE